MQLNRGPHALRRRMSSIAAMAVVLTVGVGLAACGSSSNGTSASASGSGGSSTVNGKPAKKYKMTVTLLDTSNPWTASMGEAMKKEAKRLGTDLTVVNGKLDAATQVSQIQQAVASKDNAIIVNAVDPNALVGAINQADAAGIPVIAANAAVSDKAKVKSFIGADNYAYGKTAADLAIDATGGKGNVAVIQGVIGNSIEALRTKGIQDTLKTAPGIKVVAKVTDQWNNAKNIAAVRDLLNRFPKGQLNAIIAEGPELYVGAETAHKLGRDDVKFIAGDLPIQVRKSIQDGTLYGTVLQDPAAQGVAAVQAAYNWLSGKQSQVQKTHYVDLPKVTKDNVNTFATNWSW